MDPQKLHYLGVISNANHSLSRIDFGQGYRVEPIDVNDLIDLLCELYGLPEHEIYYKIEAFFGYQRPKRTIYVIKRDWDDWPYLLNDSSKNSSDTWLDDFMPSHRLMDGLQSSVEEKLRLLRLCNQGDLYFGLYAYFNYEEFEGEIKPSMISMREDMFSRQGKVFNVPKKSLHRFNEFITNNHIATFQPNVKLAIKSFDLSFEVYDEMMSFLSLMTALESLLNESHQELKFRLSRSVAVLIGESKRKSQKIFEDMKILYDKRSQLVHAGSSKKFQPSDIEILREYVRLSILRVIELGKSKKELNDLLMGLGFGDGYRLR